MYLEDVDVYFYELFYADEYGTHITFFFSCLLWLSLVPCALRSLQLLLAVVFWCIGGVFCLSSEKQVGDIVASSLRPLSWHSQFGGLSLYFSVVFCYNNLTLLRVSTRFCFT